ncbi:DNA/RNA polymerase [Schizopora paradoxa]|uniref:DNA-directed RNA polymerase n=1 Tax=Schizopora paradoxa TaxID=27342 RepID=A0A0H2RX64_9AGAM|nr:DNA/RNA polymerase [Schizopora paradoxa]
MIPLTRRTTSRVFAPSFSCARQRLPRPARLYTTPTRRTDAPAFATAHAVPKETYPAYMPPQRQQESAVNNDEGVDAFLSQHAPYTLIPTPLPADRSSRLNDFYFTDSSTQDALSVIDACLHNTYDVPRAKAVFKHLREGRKGDPILHTPLYNAFLSAFLSMAEKDFEKRDDWLRDSWALYESMERNDEHVKPNAGTYAIMLQTWLKFNSETETPFANLSATDAAPGDLLQRLVARDISPTSVIADAVITSAKTASQIAEHISRAAAQLGMTQVITELGKVEAIAADPLAEVPEIIPVLARKPVPLFEEFDPKEATELARTHTPVVESEIPFNLDNLRKHLADVSYARRVLPDDAFTRQKLLEASVYDAASKRMQRESEKLEELGLGNKNLQHEQLQKWMFDWHNKLKSRIEVEIEVLKKEEDAKPRNSEKYVRLSPFVSLLTPNKLSLITILELMHLQGTGGIMEGMKTARALITVGKAVEMEYKAEMLKKNNITLPQAPARPPSYFTKRAINDLKDWRTNAQTYVENSMSWTADWSHSLCARVGSFLVDCLMEVATVRRTTVDKRTGEEVSEDHPAFYHSYEYNRGHKLGVIRLNTVVAERLAKDDIRSTLHPRHLPMLVKPKAWLSHDNGGYIFNKSSVMRLKDTQEQAVYLRHASERGNMELIFASLDILGSTPWKINRSVFDVVLEVWNKQERFLKIPPANYDAPEPVRPEEGDQAAKAKYLSQMKDYQIDRANNHSMRCSINYKVEIARAFLADTLYFPHNIDFRGRAYPMPPHLSHIGDDLSRGLLSFAESRPLGASGFRWLKIHLANLYGYDKASFDERVEFVHEHLDDIHDSAVNPLEGRRWWMSADDPWQCLACCIDLHKALESGDPEAYESCQPVHQDGTCNGLQHYAALGGDIKGAQQVNLDIAERPSDVYTHVATMVEEEIKKDLADGKSKYAEMLSGKIARKVVKQTVMTTVYGVTYVGARAQISKQLKDLNCIAHEDLWGASAYLAQKVMGSIGDLFSGARDIQLWLTECARLISKAIPAERVESENNMTFTRTQTKGGPRAVGKEQMTTVVWTTPMGLPVAQPYRKTKRKQVMTSVQSVYISDPTSPAEVNAIKQASAFPPNFIHSLDATHMMLTALECRVQGLTFASVHDSYWTHAATIAKLNTIIRDSFIALHESNILEKLEKEFKDRYANYKVPLSSLRGKNLQDAYALASAANRARATAAVTDAETAHIESVEEELAESESESDSEVEVELEGAESDAAPSTPAPKKRTRRPKNQKADTDERFANLVDIFPKLPQKGDFDVKKIKNSQYFFS